MLHVSICIVSSAIHAGSAFKFIFAWGAELS
jgi:hypothetical protein